MGAGSRSEPGASALVVPSMRMIAMRRNEERVERSEGRERRRRGRRAVGRMLWVSGGEVIRQVG